MNDGRRGNEFVLKGATHASLWRIFRPRGGLGFRVTACYKSYPTAFYFPNDSMHALIKIELDLM